MTVATESADVRTKLENVHANLIVYWHYVCALVNPYFKLCHYVAMHISKHTLLHTNAIIKNSCKYSVLLSEIKHDRLPISEKQPQICTHMQSTSNMHTHAVTYTRTIIDKPIHYTTKKTTKRESTNQIGTSRTMIVYNMSTLEQNYHLTSIA